MVSGHSWHILIFKMKACKIVPAQSGRGFISWSAIGLHWNWKAALLSSAFRSLVFFGANLSAGWPAAIAAMTTELVYRALASGFCGALTQRFSRIEPAWRGAVAAFVLLPLGQHSLELLVHFLRGTANLKLSVGASMAFTGLSTLINLGLMRNGVLVVGEGGKTLRQDLASLPGIVRASILSVFTARRPDLHSAVQCARAEPAGGES
jgi:hypothetical protein